MIKVVPTGSFSFDQTPWQIMPVSTRGLDRGWVEKRAAASTPLFDLSALKADPNKTYVHLIALGDGDVYGANRNGDYFSKRANQKYHHTFVKVGKYYHHHNNKDGAPVFGDIEMSAHNPDMHRVELVIGMHNDKCAADLDELEKKGELSVSMAASVPFDVCMICDNKAKNRGEYCKHAAHEMTRIYDDGRQACVDNPDPTFFDISKVWKPADRIAYTLNKVASGHEIVKSGAQLAEELGIRLRPGMTLISSKAREKLNTLNKLADIEKNISSDAAGKILELRDVMDLPPLEQHDMGQLKGSDLDAVLGEAAKQQVVIPLESLLQLVGVGNHPDLVDQTRDELPGIFGRMAGDPEVDEICSDDSYDGDAALATIKISSVISRLRSTHGVSLTAATKRATANRLEGKSPRPLRKRAASSHAAARSLAREYGKYLLSFAHNATGMGDENMVQNLTVLHSQA